MEKTKLNFFQQIKNAVLKPMEYYRLSKVSGARLTGFVFLFVFIISLFTMVPMFFELVGPNGLSKILHEDLPEFHMTDGKLYVAERFEQEEGLTYILVDTNVEEFTLDDVNTLYNEVILVSKNNMITYQNARTQIFKFSDLGNLSFDNSIINMIEPFIYIFFFIAMIIIYLFMVGAYFFTALLYSLVSLIASGISHINLPYARIFKVAIYGKVTASILSAILNVVPVNIPGFVGKGIAIVITCTYVVYGTLSHHNEEPQESAPIPPMYY